VCKLPGVFFIDNEAPFAKYTPVKYPFSVRLLGTHPKLSTMYMLAVATTSCLSCDSGRPDLHQPLSSLWGGQ
jgi:hypothetical protein